MQQTSGSIRPDRADSQIGNERLQAARQITETLRVPLQLLERLLVDLSQGEGFARDCFFERTNALDPDREEFSDGTCPCVSCH